METVNTRAYVVGDLLSSIGGFIGMFLGFGLLQVPEILSTLSHSINRFMKKDYDEHCHA